MEDQFIRFPVRAEMELHPEALELVDDEGSALVGTEFVGRLAPKCQRELAILALPERRSSAGVKAAMDSLRATDWDGSKRFLD